MIQLFQQSLKMVLHQKAQSVTKLFDSLSALLPCTEKRKTFPDGKFTFYLTGAPILLINLSAPLKDSGEAASSTLTALGDCGSSSLPELNSGCLRELRLVHPIRMFLNNPSK